MFYATQTNTNTFHLYYLPIYQQIYIAIKLHCKTLTYLIYIFQVFIINLYIHFLPIYTGNSVYHHLHISIVYS